MNAKQEVAIADFAESILLESLADPQKALQSSVPSNPSISNSVPDISDIEVSNEMVESFLTGKIVEAVAPKEELKVTLEQIVAQLIKEVTELRKQVTEMTSVGAIGVNMAGSKPKAKEVKFKKSIDKKKASKKSILLKVKEIRNRYEH